MQSLSFSSRLYLLMTSPCKELQAPRHATRKAQLAPLSPPHVSRYRRVVRAPASRAIRAPATVSQGASSISQKASSLPRATSQRSSAAAPEHLTASASTVTAAHSLRLVLDGSSKEYGNPEPTTARSRGRALLMPRRSPPRVAPPPLTARNRSPVGGPNTAAHTASSDESTKAKDTHQCGRPRRKFVVPSRGSRYQRLLPETSRSSASCVLSSPTTRSSGNASRSTEIAACSACLSAALTGSIRPFHSSSGRSSQLSSDSPAARTARRAACSSRSNRSIETSTRLVYALARPGIESVQAFEIEGYLR